MNARDMTHFEKREMYLFVNDIYIHLKYFLCGPFNPAYIKKFLKALYQTDRIMAYHIYDMIMTQVHIPFNFEDYEYLSELSDTAEPDNALFADVISVHNEPRNVSQHRSGTVGHFINLDLNENSGNTAEGSPMRTAYDMVQNLANSIYNAASLVVDRPFNVVASNDDISNIDNTSVSDTSMDNDLALLSDSERSSEVDNHNYRNALFDLDSDIDSDIDLNTFLSSDDYVLDEISSLSEIYGDNVYINDGIDDFSDIEESESSDYAESCRNAINSGDTASIDMDHCDHNHVTNNTNNVDSEEEKEASNSDQHTAATNSTASDYSNDVPVMPEMCLPFHFVDLSDFNDTDSDLTDFNDTDSDDFLKSSENEDDELFCEYDTISESSFEAPLMNFEDFDYIHGHASDTSSDESEFSEYILSSIDSEDYAIDDLVMHLPANDLYITDDSDNDDSEKSANSENAAAAVLSE